MWLVEGGCDGGCDGLIFHSRFGSFGGERLGRCEWNDIKLENENENEGH